MGRPAKSKDILTSGDGQIIDDQPIKVFVDTSWDASKVLQSDARGLELYFESVRGKFLPLSDETLAELSHDNKVRYQFAAEHHKRSNPEYDALAQQLLVSQARSRRAEVKQEMGTVPQYQLERRMLQAYVGEGYQERWVRADNIERAKMNGYDIVRADDVNCFAGAAPTENRYETKQSNGHTEGVLMRISRDDFAKHEADKATRIARQKGAALSGAQGELTRLGGLPFNESKLRGTVSMQPIESGQGET